MDTYTKVEEAIEFIDECIDRAKERNMKIYIDQKLIRRKMLISLVKDLGFGLFLLTFMFFMLTLVLNAI